MIECQWVTTPQQTGRFTVAIADVEGLGDKKVFLADKLLNIIHDLTENPYEFDSESGVFDVRFELRFVNEILSNPDFDTITSSVIAYGSEGRLNIKSTLQKITEVSVYDTLGRLIHTQKGQPVNEFESNVNFTKQTVIVQIKLENGQVVTKKLII
ncbi:T9SS sorting signal type C domain-containing protein [Flavobacterium piscinae]|uniref:T9SS sorting signal type C domain-containing protein n=1 Tax=Flavobacterium piscinae TaxID=2506424 RepID=UPI0019A832E7|nr:T9SS sorting signal type C domain-containing protein [Flavobacterium piscinae]MBC8883792.1 T9SS sorting signal type C domain-containing protein [Flavobacterium piscinae]